MRDWQGKRVLVMAGGTGGHVYPALAVAQALQERGATVAWLGNEQGFEYAKVTAAGLDFYAITVRGLRGRGWRGWLTALWMLGKALWQTWQRFRTFRPQLVLGFGGFVAGPGGLMAKLLGMPLVIHEQNAIMGMTNRYLVKWAQQVLLAYPLPETQQVPRALLTGNPVRTDIAAVPEPEKRFAGRTGAIRLLVLGGSQGARALNTVLPQALALLSPDERPQVVHQVGVQAVAEVQSAYAALGVAAEVKAFIDDMAQAYAEADWVLARAGALTVAEIATVGVAALFVPYPAAVDDHQTANAQALAQAGAAEIMAQSALSAERLAQAIRARLQRSVLLTQAQVARQQSCAHALTNIVNILEQPCFHTESDA